MPLDYGLRNPREYWEATLSVRHYWHRYIVIGPRRDCDAAKCVVDAVMLQRGYVKELRLRLPDVMRREMGIERVVLSGSGGDSGFFKRDGVIRVIGLSGEQLEMLVRHRIMNAVDPETEHIQFPLPSKGGAMKFVCY